MREMTVIESEEALVRAWAEGDADASRRLPALHGRAMLRVALALCPRPEDAEEVVQEGFLRALRSAGSFDPRRGTLRAWLVGLTANRARQLRRGAARYRNLLERMRRDPYHDGFHSEASGDLDFARRKLAALPLREREAFVLVEIEDLPSKEAAEIMGVADSTVRVLAARARTRLARRGQALRTAAMKAEGGR